MSTWKAFTLKEKSPCNPPLPSLVSPRSQFEYRPWVAADVALYRLVPAQSQFDEIRKTFPGVTAKRTAGCFLLAEAAGYAEVRLGSETDITQ